MRHVLSLVYEWLIIFYTHMQPRRKSEQIVIGKIKELELDSII